MYKTFLDATEARLLSLVSQKKKENPLDQSIHYLLQTGGKRIRPILLLAACEELGYPWEKALDVAASLEYIHCYSLIHDDLPCMDDDNYRRGMPTLHKRFNEALAVLTGDFFLTFAFEVLSSSPIDPSVKIELIKLIAQRAGAQGMIGGQILDLHPSKEKNYASIAKTHRKKTAALFAGSLEAAGMIASVSKRTLFNLRKIGLCFGLCFQLVDDIDDQKKDKKENNLVLMIGEEKARELQSLYQARIEKNLAKIATKGILHEIISLFLQTKKRPLYIDLQY